MQTPDRRQEKDKEPEGGEDDIGLPFDHAHSCYELWRGEKDANGLIADEDPDHTKECVPEDDTSDSPERRIRPVAMPSFPFRHGFLHLQL